MIKKIIKTNKSIVISKFGELQNKEDCNIFWMTENEFTKIIVGKKASNSEYVISEGVIEPEGFVPDHYHKWEDQTFHIVEGSVEAKIGNETVFLGGKDITYVCRSPQCSGIDPSEGCGPIQDGYGCSFYFYPVALNWYFYNR